MPVSREVMVLAAGTEVALPQRKSLLTSVNLKIITSYKAPGANSIKRCAHSFELPSSNVSVV